MDLSEVIAAIGGPSAVPHQPEGGSDVTPLSPLGLDKSTPEPFPATVAPQQGAGSSAGYLTPGAKGTASDGTVEPGNVHGYSASGPAMLTPSQGIGALTPDPSHGRPMDGVAPPAAPVGRDDTALGRDQGDGQSLNPALKAALAPRPGPFGDPSK